MGKRRIKEWQECPKRMCYTLHTCSVCLERITLGQEYYDCGHRRCHIACAPPNKAIEPTARNGGS